MQPATRILLAGLTGIVLLGGGGPAEAQQKEITPDEVHTAIRKARTWLISKQSGDGSFKAKSGGHLIGTSSLALLALVNSGMSPDDAAIRKGLTYLRRVELPDQTYDISLMVMALATAKNKRDNFRISQLVSLLEKGQAKAGAGKVGGWPYFCRDSKLAVDRPDRSNSQFAVLALRDAVRAGVSVKKSTWQRVKTYWENGQGGDGGWAYISKNRPSRGSMTVAGISSLVIVSQMLQEDKPGQKPDCCATYKPYPELERGIKRLGRAIAVNRTSVRNFGSGKSTLYYLYGLERAGRLSGRRLFGGRDWYREGATYLVREQHRFGYWIGNGYGETDPLIGTSMALLFLSKGLAPVLVNKLKYGPAKKGNPLDVQGDNWNRHRNDSRNITEYITTRDKWPQLLTWQTVEMRKMLRLDDEEAADALDQAKVLLISGRESPDELINDPKQYGYLFDYVKRGGFIFAVGNCDRNGGFDKGFRKLVQNMFKRNGKIDLNATLKRLPKDHPVYRSEHKLFDKWEEIELYGVTFGCRTAVIYAPVGKGKMEGFDLSCYWNDWQMQPTRKTHEWVGRAMEIGENVLAYATGREPPEKLRLKDPRGKKGKNPIERGFLQVAKIIHTGDWDVAPRALRNLLYALNEANGKTASTVPKNISPAGKEIFQYPVVYMHGRSNFSLSKTARKDLGTYLKERGGLLFADACCGSPQFDKSFRELMGQLFPGKPLKRIPMTHELFTQKTGFNIRKVTRRMPESANKKAKIINVTKQVDPYLEGIEVDGRLVVIYSKYDISCALERQASISCSGYIEQDAMKIGINVLLYALLQDVRYSRLFD